MGEIRQLEETIMELTKEVKKLREQVGEAPQRSVKLLSSKDVIERLGLKKDNKTWRRIREILIAEYGMSAIPPLGVRIPERNFEKFLRDRFTP